jgi:hypothetical protein
MRSRLIGLAAIVAGLVACKRTHEPPEGFAPPPPVVEQVAVAPSAEPAPWPPPLPAPAPKAAPAPPPPVDPIKMPPMADGGTVNGSSRGPKAEALNAVIQGARRPLQGCLDGAAGIPAGVEVQVAVSYRILPDGHARDIAVTGAPAGAADCMGKVIDGLRFPPFEGDPVAGSFPYAYRRQ